eukprot:tig00021290_g19969.t1
MRKADRAGLMHPPGYGIGVLDSTMAVFRAEAANCLGRKRPLIFRAEAANCLGLLDATCLVYPTTQIPYIYTRLIGLVTRVHLMMTCVLAATWFSNGIVQKSADKLVYAILLMFVNSIIYEGIIRFHRELWNPYDKYATNFPTRVYWDAIRTLSGRLLEVPSAPRARPGAGAGAGPAPRQEQPLRSGGAGTLSAASHLPVPPKPDMLVDGPTPPTSPPLKPAAWIKDANGAPNGSAPAPPPDPSPGPEPPAALNSSGPISDGRAVLHRVLSDAGFRPVYAPSESSPPSSLQPSSAPLFAAPVPVPVPPLDPPTDGDAPAPASAPAFPPPPAPPSLALPPAAPFSEQPVRGPSPALNLPAAAKGNDAPRVSSLPSRYPPDSSPGPSPARPQTGTRRRPSLLPGPPYMHALDPHAPVPLPPAAPSPSPSPKPGSAVPLRAQTPTQAGAGRGTPGPRTGPQVTFAPVPVQHKRDAHFGSAAAYAPPPPPVELALGSVVLGFESGQELEGSPDPDVFAPHIERGVTGRG